MMYHYYTICFNFPDDGARKLWNRIVELYAGISEHYIQNWLNRQEVHGQRAPIFRNVAPMTSIVASAIQERNQVDLVDMSKHPQAYEGETYTQILSIEDIFSRHLFLRPLKGKYAAYVALELYNLYVVIGPPMIIQSDKGTEFKGVVKELCQKLGCRIIYSRAYHPESQGKVR